MGLTRIKTEENARETCAKEYKNLKGFFIKSIKKL